MNDAGHIPVLSEEVVEALHLPRDGTLIDATFGRGGHARCCLERLGPEGRIVAIDRDPDAVAYGRARFRGEPRLSVHHERFSALDRVVREHCPGARVDAVLFDLGVSSPQLDRAERGFGFSVPGPLDMRMDPGRGPSALDWLRRVREDELARVIRVYGEERYARRIAAAVKQAVRDGALETTGDLAAAVSAAAPTRERRKHPATRTFQAIRMELNEELPELKAALAKALEALAAGGRLAVICFHSLEDRVVKRFFREQGTGDAFPPELPVTADRLRPRLRRVGRARRAGEAELRRNPRARGAVLRVAEKLR